MSNKFQSLKAKEKTMGKTVNTLSNTKRTVSMNTMNSTIGSSPKSYCGDNNRQRNKKDESILSCRYKLNQYYLNKYNEEKMKYKRSNSPCYLNHFSQDSFLMEKMLNSSRNQVGEEGIITEPKYDFKTNLYDGQYHERLNSFNSKRNKSPNQSRDMDNSSLNFNYSNRNWNSLTNDTTNNNNNNKNTQMYQQPNNPLTASLYQRSNLSTYVPSRRITVDVHHCHSQCQTPYNLNCPYHNNTKY